MYLFYQRVYNYPDLKKRERDEDGMMSTQPAAVAPITGNGNDLEGPGEFKDNTQDVVHAQNQEINIKDPQLRDVQTTALGKYVDDGNGQQLVGANLNTTPTQGVKEIHVPLLQQLDAFLHRENKVTVTSVVENNYTGSKYNGMEGYEIITYQTDDGQIKEYRVDGVIWYKDKSVGETGYDYPTHPGTFNMSYNPNSDKFSKHIESSYEDGIFVHDNYYSKGCIVFGNGNDPIVITALQNMLESLQDGQQMKAEIHVVDNRLLSEQNLRPIPYLPK